MRDLQVIRIVWLGLIAIVGILAVQTYWGITTWTANESDVNQKIHLALRRVAESLAVANGTVLPTGNIIRKRSANYYLVNIAYEIDANLLEFYLRKELEALTVNLDFEYAIFDCSTDEMVYGAYCAYEPAKKAPEISKSMPGYHAFTYYFAVKFPGRSSFLWGQFQVVLFFSVILFVTIIFFSYSLFVIVRQKWLFEQQKDFINNMTHEFKTPIATISLAADSLNNPAVLKNEDKILRFSRIIKQENIRMHKQVEKVLQMALLDKKDFNLKWASINMHDLILAAIENISLQVEAREGSVQGFLNAASPVINGDQTHLSNIINNLLDNANKYSPQKPHITVFTRNVDKGLEIIVKDEGIGLSRDVRKFIFDKFYRVPTGNIHNVKGFGLGLSYVKTMVEAHKGKIDVRSELGKGSSFILFFPLH